MDIEIMKTPYNSGFAQRGVWCSKKASRCFEVFVTFDTIEP